jgi:hypothetical protein
MILIYEDEYENASPEVLGEATVRSRPDHSAVAITLSPSPVSAVMAAGRRC